MENSSNILSNMKNKLRKANILSAAFLVLCVAITPGVAHGQQVQSTQAFISCLDSKIYCEIAGEGPAVILAHAGYLDTRMWDAQFAALAGAGYQVIRFDHFGHGRTLDGKNTPFHWEVFEAILDHYGISRAAIIGCSMGSRAAIEFAIEKPGRVSAMVLGSPGVNGYDFGKDDLLRPLLGELIDAYSENDTMRAVEAFTRSWTDGPHRTGSDVKESIRMQVQGMIRERYKLHGFRKNALEIHPKAIGSLPAIETPCLVITGDLDMPCIKDIAGILREEIPNAQVHVIGGAGHMCNMEKPEEYNRIVTDYLHKHLR